jgi:ABC-type transporter Mla subunit MlaD
MKRLLLIGAFVVVVVVAVVAVTLVHKGQPTYRVRAIFDNAGFVIPGEDVRVAGVKVGSIEKLDVTQDFKAAVVMDITQPGYQDFRRDAECQIRPQSLIGERFVECTPTQAHAVGQQPPPALPQIRSGPDKGEHVLPVSNTATTVDIDLIGDVMREPVRQRLSLILNELGTGLAGRGADLNDVIRRANPALKETDKVLKILASQNRVLKELAVNSDTVLAPLARERAHVAGAIRNSNTVAEATAERRGALETDIRLLPPFLRQLRPTMQRLGTLSDQMTPVLADAHAVAPDINHVIERLGPFSSASIPAVKSLGQASKAGIPAVTDSRPVIGDLRKLAKAVRPVGHTGAAVLDSLKKTQGIERLMDYVFYQVAAINGFDSIGHYLRAGLIVNQCAIYATRPVGGCSANFSGASAATASAASAGSSPLGVAADDPVLVRTARALAAALGRQPKTQAVKHRHARKHHRAKKKHRRAHRRAPKTRAGKPAPAAKPGVPSVPSVPSVPNVPPVAGARATPTPTPTPTPAPGDPAQGLLDYLFGKPGR